jgi:nitroreductase/NAD-dependent dihydropyrimidine dehydrogenase PreA subunit
MELQFGVDEELCISCGECAKDCPFQLIEMKNDVPTLAKENEANCVQCQHCLAVCSTGALTILGKNPADSIPLTGSEVPAQQLAILMKGRRSVRRYKQEPVSPAEIAFLLDTVGYAPTGVNNRQVLLTVVDDPAIMDSLRRKTYAALKKICDNGGFPDGMDYLKGYVLDALETGRDNLFRGAPHLLIASAPTTAPTPEADCFIALSYFELLAASMGLGTVWSGLAKWTLTAITPEILAGLGVPASHQVGYMMVFGRPDVVYRRTVQRDSAPINRVRQLA